VLPAITHSIPVVVKAQQFLCHFTFLPYRLSSPPLGAGQGHHHAQWMGLESWQFTTQVWPNLTYRCSDFPCGYLEGSHTRTRKCERNSHWLTEQKIKGEDLRCNSIWLRLQLQPPIISWEAMAISAMCHFAFAFPLSLPHFQFSLTSTSWHCMSLASPIMY
jgi:hypothetical protein